VPSQLNEEAAAILNQKIPITFANYMSRKNSQKMAEIKEMPNVFERDDQLTRPYWYYDYFQDRNAPLVLELGCGRGEFSIGLGQQFPEKNYIGIDIKGPRIWAGANNAVNLGLSNVAFARFRIEYIAQYFEPQSVDEIWIPHPDPFPRKSKSGRRLTSPEFLERYQPLIKSTTIFHFKTDSTDLFDWTLDVYQNQLKDKIEILDYTKDLYSLDNSRSHLAAIPSKYERVFMEKGERIKYMMFRMR
jgi:tRNA (guanine-N7-)-methyltransferase